MSKVITLVCDMSFEKEDEDTIDSQWEDMLQSPDNTCYVVFDELRGDETFYNLDKAKKAAGWIN